MSDAPTHADDFAEALASVVQDSPYTLGALQQELTARGHKVSVATLSYWQTGGSLPARAGSIATLTAIEEILGLTPRTLHDALRMNDEPQWSPLGVFSEPQDPEESLARMGLSFSEPYTVLLTSDIIHTSTHLGIERQVVRQLIRADDDGVHRFPAVFQTDVSTPPAISVTEGLVLGEVVPTLAGAGIVAELVLPRTLKAGDMHWLEYEVAWDSIPQTENAHARSTQTGRPTWCSARSSRASARPRPPSTTVEWTAGPSPNWAPGTPCRRRFSTSSATPRRASSRSSGGCDLAIRQ